jgi:hypothetical protein
MEGVKSLLDGLLAHDTTAEFLEQIAADLKAVGLRKVAQAVREAAEEAPAEADLCPYPDGSINARSWLQALERRQRRATSTGS